MAKGVYIKRYFSIIFIIAVLMGVFHHHNDLKQHNDCQICTIQSTLADADTPADKVYVTELEKFSELIAATLSHLQPYRFQTTLQVRAPPISDLF